MRKQESSWSTAARDSLGYFLYDACWDVNDDWFMLIIWSTESCVMVGTLLCVFHAGELSCSSSNVGVLETLVDGVISCVTVFAVRIGDTLGVGTLSSSSSSPACISGVGSSCVVVGLIIFS